MPYVMNMVVMCHVQYLSTEKEDENLQTVPKSKPMILTKLILQYIYRMLMRNEVCK